MMRIGIARFLGLDEAQVRVIAPDVGGGFGYKCMLHPEELCVAWLALKYRQPFRYIEDRREHLVAGANSPPAPLRADRLCRRARAAARARCRDHDRRRRLFELAVHHRPGARAGDRQPARSLRLPRLPLQDLLRGDQQAGLRALSRRGAHRRVLRDGADDRRDRARGRPRPVGGAPREPGAGPSRCRTTTSRASTTTAATIRARCAWRAEKLDVAKCARAPAARRARRPHHRRRLRQLLRAVGAWHERVRGLGPADRSRLRPGDGARHARTAGWRSASACIRTARAWRRRSRRSRTRCSASTSSRIQVVHGDTGTTPFSTGTYASRSMVMAGGAVVECLPELIPRYREHRRAPAQVHRSPRCRFENGRGRSAPTGSVA